MQRRIGRYVKGYLFTKRKYFHDGRDQIADTNLFMLRRYTVAAVILLAAIVAAIFFLDRKPEWIAVGSVTLAFQAGLCAVVYLYDRYLRHYYRRIRLACLLYMLSLEAFTTYVSLAGPSGEPGIFFAPMMLLITVSFIMPMWQSLSMQLVFSAVFLGVNAALKGPDHFRLDIAIVAVTWALSAVSVFEMIEMRMRNYRLQSELMRQSHTDGLTGLMNKTTAETAARAYLCHGGATEGAALMVIDLDQFKQINDVLGHQAGDEALETFGETLTTLFRAQDIVGRVGGDEFIVLFRKMNDRELIARRAREICDSVRKARYNRVGLTVTCSIGIALCPEHGTDYDTLFRKADKQMYVLKKGKRDGYLIVE